MPVEETDVVVLGGGLAGLSLAAEYGPGAVVLERHDRPGGLVRTEHRHGYWFDHVLHLLHVPDPATESLVRQLLGDDLARCPPRAWIACPDGVTGYPFQQHLAGLRLPARIACVAGFTAATLGRRRGRPGNYAELLLSTFGAGMCEQFFFPYNRKLWCRPLESLAATGFQWNLARPALAAVLRGAVAAGSSGPAAYNSNGWYPRPPAGAPVRGMELLSRALARRAADLRPRHRAVAVDPARRTVTYLAGGRAGVLKYRRACVSTVPLPVTVRLCVQAPAGLRRAAARLPFNRVRSVALSMRGPRPDQLGLWRYYTDESLPYTRLVFLTNFDPLMAPSDGWSLLAEVPEPGEQPPAPTGRLVASVLDGLARTPELPDRREVVDSHVIDADPAYVVFTVAAQEVAERARAFLAGHDVIPLGRYGSWAYSSMAQVMADGRRLAHRLRGRPDPA